MEIWEKLKGYRRGNGPKVFSVEETHRLGQRDGIEVMKTQNNVIKVDFSENLQFTDRNEASICVIVMTSDGKIGTLSHLQIDAPTGRIADTVLAVHDGKPTAVCLAGGTSFASDRLITDIRQEFGQRGFVVSELPEHNDVGGAFHFRESTLFPTHVEVLNYFSGGNQTVTLQFPSIEQTAPSMVF